ncbi:cbb3-type cytochrome c oxidase subunit I, partial [Rossellomorea marisflavi]|uniref:cbb3-type cytochrome c oxidase subunit I n=1 Tax=Rossellomorea marisflavi TaxID=189381 RepID=UPI00295EBBDA
HLTGRVLTKEMNRLAIIQAIVWTVGMGIMSLSMHAAGLLGAPRRSAFSTYGDAQQAIAWIPYQAAQAIGGTILFIGIILVLYIVVNLAFFSPKGTETFPVADSGSAKTPKALEDWRIWLTILTALILIAYSVPFIDMIQQAPPASKGYRLW